MGMKETKMTFWFPIFLPVLLGILYALVKLPYDTAETTTIVKVLEMVGQQSEIPGIEEILEIERIEEILEPEEIEKLQTSSEPEIKEFMDKLIDKGITGAIIADILRLVSWLCEGIVSSVIAIDIWAFTTLYSTRRQYTIGSTIRLPYEYPVLGIIIHIILMLAVSVFQELATLKTYHSVMIGMMVVAALGSIYVSWFVRNGIWQKFEIPLENAKIDDVKAHNVGRDPQ